MGLGHCGQQQPTTQVMDSIAGLDHGRVRIIDCSNATVNKIDVYVSAVG